MLQDLMRINLSKSLCRTCNWVAEVTMPNGRFLGYRCVNDNAMLHLAVNIKYHCDDYQEVNNG